MDPIETYIDEAERLAKRARILAFGRLPTDSNPVALPSSEIARFEKIVAALDSAGEMLAAARRACAEDMTVNQGLVG